MKCEFYRGGYDAVQRTLLTFWTGHVWTLWDQYPAATIESTSQTITLYFGAEEEVMQQKTMRNYVQSIWGHVQWLYHRCNSHSGWRRPVLECSWYMYTGGDNQLREQTRCTQSILTPAPAFYIVVSSHLPFKLTFFVIPWTFCYIRLHYATLCYYMYLELWGRTFCGSVG